MYWLARSILDFQCCTFHLARIRWILFCSANLSLDTSSHNIQFHTWFLNWQNYHVFESISPEMALDAMLRIHADVIAQMPTPSFTYAGWFNISLNNELLRLKNHEKNYSIFVVLINGFTCANRRADIMSFCQRWTNSNTININADVAQTMRMSIFGQVIVNVLIEHICLQRKTAEDECGWCLMNIFHFECLFNLKNWFLFRTPANYCSIGTPNRQ